MSKEVENILGSDDPHPGGDLESGRRVGLETEGYLVDTQNLTIQNPGYLFMDDTLVTEGVKVEDELTEGSVEVRSDGGHRIQELEALFMMNFRRVFAATEQRGHDILFAPVYHFGTPGYNRSSAEMERWVRSQGLQDGDANKSATSGLHFHHEFSDWDEVTELFRIMRAHSPLVIAQSANSPFSAERTWNGNMSERCVARGQLPNGGAPKQLPVERGRDLPAYLKREMDAGRIDKLTPPPWDVRVPRIQYGTLEVTAYDMSEDPRDWFSQLDMSYAVRMAHAYHFEVGKELPRELINPDIPQSVLVENRQRAVRDGMEASLVDGRGRERPAKEMTERWMRFLEQVRVPLRRVQTREHVTALLDHGSRAERMVREYEDRMGRPLRMGEQADIDVLRDMYRDRLQLSRRIIIEDPLAGRPANGRKMNGNVTRMPCPQLESAMA